MSPIHDSDPYLAVPPVAWGTTKRLYDEHDAPSTTGSSPKKPCTPENTFLSQHSPGSDGNYVASPVDPVLESVIPPTGVGFEHNLSGRPLHEMNTSLSPVPLNNHDWTTTDSSLTPWMDFMPKEPFAGDPSSIRGQGASPLHFDDSPSYQPSGRPHGATHSAMQTDPDVKTTEDFDLPDTIKTETGLDSQAVLLGLPYESFHISNSEPPVSVGDHTTAVPPTSEVITGQAGMSFQVSPCSEVPVKAKSTSEEALVDPSGVDTCLGFVLIDSIRYREPEKMAQRGIKVKIDIFDTLLIIRNAHSNAYIGSAGRERAAVMKGLETRKARLSGMAKPPNTLEILIYSPLEDANSIGDYLSDANWFLQQPDSFDITTTYHNPHLLLPSGTDQAPIYHQDLAIPQQTATLGTAEKSEIAELLDSATGPASFNVARVSELLTTELKSHQIKALSMMVEKESGLLHGSAFPSLWTTAVDEKSNTTRYLNTVTGSKRTAKPPLCLGGLLADDMGLGKTLTALSLVAGSLYQDNYGTYLAHGPTLIIAPLSTLPNWETQIEKHFKPGSIRAIVYHGSARLTDPTLLRNNHIILTTYDTVRTETLAKPRKGTKKQEPDGSSDKRSVLQSIQWHRVVLDEAHLIRNCKSKAFSAVKALDSKHRWCITGTPIQNSLKDLGSLVEFLRIHPFDTPCKFRDTFTVERKGREHLKSLIQCITIRRTKATMEHEINLPERVHIVESVPLDSDEQQTYDLIKRHFALSIDTGGSMMNAFSFILRLRQVSNHGLDLLPAPLRKWVQEARFFSEKTAPDLAGCEICNSSPTQKGNFPVLLSCGHQLCRACINADDKSRKEKSPACPLCEGTLVESPSQFVDSLISDSLSTYRPSSKVRALLTNLQEDRDDATGRGLCPEKSVVFSTWTSMLDLIGKGLAVHGFSYQRLDGSRSLSQRRQALSEFRDAPECQVLLATLGAAGVGIDLTMATRVHIVEPGWNPMLEHQAIDRIHRLGQVKQVVSRCYVASGPGSVEEYVRKRQEWKVDLIAASFGSSLVPGELQAGSLLQDLRNSLGIN